MKVLITGFSPFANHSDNPSWQAVKSLQDSYDKIAIVKRQLPVVFHDSIKVLQAIALQEQPDIIICVGLASNRFDISLERVAINVDDASIPDNNNKVLIDKPIFNDGPDAYFSSLPIKAIVKNLQDNNIKSSISNSAGTYVCNHIMYGLLHLIKQEKIALKGGFVHVPELENMSLEQIIIALEIIIKTSVSINDDLKITYGKVS